MNACEMKADFWIVRGFMIPCQNWYHDLGSALSLSIPGQLISDTASTEYTIKANVL